MIVAKFDEKQLLNRKNIHSHSFAKRSEIMKSTQCKEKDIFGEISQKNCYQ